MQAGFAKVCITPPLLTRMEGFCGLYIDRPGAEEVHDDLFVRALSVLRKLNAGGLESV